MAKINARFVKSNSNHFQTGAGDALELKLKPGGGITSDAAGLFVDATIAGDLIFKGNLDASALGAQLTNAKSGWFWKCSVAGVLLGMELAVGDNLYCTADVTGVPANMANFSKIDNSEDTNNVKNAGASTQRSVPRFTDATGKVVEASGVVIDVDNSMNLPSAAKYKINGTQIATGDVVGATDKSERKVIAAGDITAKFFDCSFTAFDLAAVDVVVGGVFQDRTTDFVATNTGAAGVLRIGWTGLGLDGLIAAGDVASVIYTK